MSRSPFLLAAGLALVVGAVAAALLATSSGDGGSGGDGTGDAVPRESSPSGDSSPIAVAPREPAGPGGAGSGGTTAPRAEGEVQGEVVDDAGRPVAGADVTLARLGIGARRGVPMGDEPAFSRTTSDPDGAFALAAPPEGWMRVTAAAAGRATVGAIVGARGTHVVLRLPPAGSLRVTVLDGEGAPVPAAEVEVAAADASLSGTASAGGVATFHAVAPGPAVVRARAEGRAEATAGPVLVAIGEVREVLVSLAGLVRLGGRVVDDATGAPIAGARVFVARPGKAAAAGPTGADGSFQAVPAGAPGDEVLLSASATGYAPSLRPFVLGPHVTETSALVRLAPAKPWRGRVVDGSGRAAPGARVAYTEDGIAGKAPDETRSDAEGRFELPPPPPPAPGRRVVLVAEGAGGRAALALRPGMEQPGDLVLALAPGVAVTGRVARPDGIPLAGAEVGLEVAWDLLPDRSEPGPAVSRLHALNATGAEGLTTATDAAGRFALAAVPEGTFRVRIDVGGARRSIAEPVVVGAGALDLGTLVVGAGVALEGRVRDPSGRPVAGATVRAATSERGRPTVSARTDGSGNFTLPDLAAGRWSVEATLTDFGPVREEVEVPAVRSVDLVLDEGTVIEGTVTEQGEPHRGVFTVRLDRADGSARATTRRTFTSADGRFELHGAPAGEWFVRAEAPGGLVAVHTDPVWARASTRAEVSLDLRAGGALAGRVLDAGRRAVAGARLFLRPDGPGSPERATADLGGRWSFSGLLAGSYALDASGSGGVPTTERVEVGTGEHRTVDVVLPRGGALRVVVRGSDGRPRAGAMLTFRGPDGRGLSRDEPTRTDAEGVALREDLPAGRVEVRARTVRGEVGIVGGDVLEGAVAEVTLVVSPP